MSQPDYLISTPENVDLHLELAGLGNRIMACLIDTGITYSLVLLVGLGCLMAVMGLDFLPAGSSFRAIAMYSVIGIGILVSLFIIFGYYIFFEGMWHGQTPGKRITGIRVIEQNGHPASWSAVIIRNLLRVIDVGVALVGLVAMLVDRNERRLGDLAAGTMVIRERLAGELAPVLTIKATAPASGSMDIGRLSPKEYQMLLDFLSRREALTTSQRQLIARRLENYFRAKIEVPPEGESPEFFLERLYLAYQQRAAAE
jgi:uncharacterized RDD family membrane protein YckC